MAACQGRRIARRKREKCLLDELALSEDPLVDGEPDSRFSCPLCVNDETDYTCMSCKADADERL